MKTLSLKTQLLQILLVTLFVSCVTIYAAPGDIDPSFNAALYDYPVGKIDQITVLPDGKVLVAGFFSAQRGKTRPGIARLNADGTLDETFNPPAITPSAYGNSIIKAFAVQTDGKIVIGGEFTSIDGVIVSGVVRLNADGSLDTSFVQANPAINGFGISNGRGELLDLDIAPDGKIVVVGRFYYRTGGLTLINVVRLNTDGNLDTSFNYLHNDPNDPVVRVKIQADGKSVLASSAELFRLNTDGSRDSSFTTALPRVYAIEIQSDGRIMIGGDSRLARLLPNGAFDPTYNPNGYRPSAAVRTITQLPDGRYLIGGDFFRYNGIERSRVAVIQADGSLDTSFNYNFQNPTPSMFASAVQADGKLWIGGGANAATVTAPGSHDPLNRLNANGTVDLAGETGYVSRVNKVMALPNGKVLAAGNFDKANGSTVNSFARFNADGTRDTTFDTSFIGPLKEIWGFDVQADGKTLVGVSAAALPPYESVVYRLNDNGSIDLAIPISEREIQEVKSLPDGKILISAGVFSTSVLRRYLANGTLDASLSASADSRITRFLVQPDGKIVISGDFTRINGQERRRIARLNPDGTLDTSFNVAVVSNGSVYTLDRQTDGKIVIGGNFTDIGGRSFIARLNQDGSIDTSFTTVVNSWVNAVKIQPDRKIVIGGYFTLLNNVEITKLAKLNVNGTLDASFSTGFIGFGPVTAIDLQTDGKLIIGGEFVGYKQRAVSGLARIENTVNTIIGRTPFDFDGDGRADISLFRPSNGTWYQLTGPNYNFASAQFGVSTDIVTPADYDGDGKTDLAVYRGGNWYILGSTSGFSSVTFGQAGDIPLPADLDGDGKAELIVFRPSTNIWYSFNRANNQSSSIVFGNPNDRPVIGDYDGDGKSDIAVYRPTTGQWFYAASSQNGAAVLAATWGLAADKAVPADYDGDGKTDAAIFRDGIWAIKNSGNASETILGFGTAGDLPVAADYDGDGRADIAVFRPTDGAWYQLRTAQGFQGIGFGANGDRPVPNAYVR